MPFSFAGSPLAESSCWSPDCNGIGKVVQRERWPTEPFEWAGEDDDVLVGPAAPDIEESGAEDKTTWRWWDERSELCRFKPVSETFALRI